ncbi:MAG: hypothetical protein AMXMBFR64_07480 [Myxococcales bacterium]
MLQGGIDGALIACPRRHLRTKPSFSCFGCGPIIALPAAASLDPSQGAFYFNDPLSARTGPGAVPVSRTGTGTGTGAGSHPVG